MEQIENMYDKINFVLNNELTCENNSFAFANNKSSRPFGFVFKMCLTTTIALSLGCVKNGQINQTQFKQTFYEGYGNDNIISVNMDSSYIYNSYNNIDLVKNSFLNMIKKLKNFKQGWDGDNAEAFTDNSIRLFDYIINNLSIQPNFIEATQNGDLYMEYKSKDDSELIYELGEKQLEMVSFKGDTIVNKRNIYAENYQKAFSEICLKVITEDIGVFYES